jgi:hypothetical protein
VVSRSESGAVYEGERRVAELVIAHTLLAILMAALGVLAGASLLSASGREAAFHLVKDLFAVQ